jgi:hypothetical protein
VEIKDKLPGEEAKEDLSRIITRWRRRERSFRGKGRRR